MAGEPPEPPEPPDDEFDQATPSNNGRNTKGQFERGVHNPRTGRVGSRHKFLRAIDELVRDGLNDVVKKTMEQAKTGDIASARLIHEWYVSKTQPVRINLEPYAITAPTNAEEANAILAQLATDIAAGIIDLETANAIANTLKLYLISKYGGFEEKLMDVARQLGVPE